MNISIYKKPSSIVLSLFISFILILLLFSSDLQANILLSIGLISVNFMVFWKYSGFRNIAYTLFIISFIVFHFGLLSLFSFNVEQNNFYLFQFSDSLLNDVVLYQLLCILSLFAAGIFCPYIKPFKFNYINKIPDNLIINFSKIGFKICFAIECILLMLKWKVFIAGGDGYESVRQFEGTIPTPIYLLEYFFIPFAFVILIYDKGNIKRYKAAVLIWSVITALMGDRTSGIAGIICIMLVDLYKGKPLNLKRYLILLISFVVVIFMIAFIAYFRVGASSSEMGNPLFAVFAELGFNFVPVAFTIMVFPVKFGFKYGATYLFSTIAALLPSSLDITGISKIAYDIGYESAAITQKYSGYDFGIGYSLCAESYANFGFLGFIMIFLEGLLIIKLLAYNNQNLFSKYVSITLLFQYFTLPRRHYYNLINHVFWCVIIIMLLISIYLVIRKGVLNRK